MKPSGAPLLSDIPWGSHGCLFYQKKGDLLDILVPYFKAGLGNNEFCMWVCCEPLRAEEARRVLAKVIPEFNSYREKGQIEILPHTDWFLLGGRFNPEHVLRGWKDKLNQALARNFEGLRLSGNTFWLGKRDWKRFAGYEEDVNRMITEHKMIALCAYSLDRCGVGEIIDVISNHQSTVIRRGRTWTKVENSSFLKIAERKRHEVAAREGEKLLEASFSSIITPLALLDRDFNFLRVNEAYARSCQKQVADFPGTNHFELFPNEENKAIFENVVKSKEPFQVQAKPFVYPEHPDWGVTYWDWSLSPVLDDKGEVQFLVFSLNDVTPEARSQAKLRLNEELLRSVLSALPVGVWTVDARGRIIHGNPAGEEIWGGARYVGLEDFSKLKGWWLNSGKGIAPGEWAGVRAFQKGETSINEEIEIETLDGKRKIIRNSAIPIRNARNEVTRAIIVNQDITEEVKLQRRIWQKQKLEALGTLAGGIAHDFNNILMPIIINAEMVLEQAGEEESSLRSLQLILQAARRGKELVNQIISYSRPKEPERKPVEIAQLVQEALKFLRSSIPSGIQIREVMDAGAAMCLADPTQIHQVVMNLCQNAACAMQDGEGILEVDLAVIGVSEDLPASGHDLKPGSYIKLSVSGTGEGMRPEVLERAFDPFFTAKKPGEGAGMGLSVAMGIIKSHGGVITGSSQLGKGSVFHVYLPRIEGAQAPPVAPPFPVPRGQARILFVDDEDIQVRTMTAMLERLGYQVIGKTDPRDALQEFRLRPEAFDLIITDQNMPLLAGEKLAGEILRLRPEMPIILCTGYSAQVDEETAKAIGIREFVMKPFSIQEIAGTIRRVLES